MSSITYTLQHLLGRFNEELFLNTGGVNIGGKKIKCIRFANDMALLAEEEQMLKNMLMDLNDMLGLWDEDKYKEDEGHGYRKKQKKIDIRIKDESVEEVDSSKCLGCHINSDTNCCQEVKQRIAVAKEAFNRKRSIFCSSLGEKKLRKRLVNCFVCSVTLYVAEAWTLLRNEQKRLEVFEMWIWRRRPPVWYSG